MTTRCMIGRVEQKNEGKKNRRKTNTHLAVPPRSPFCAATLFPSVQSAYHLAATAFGRAGLWRQGIRLTGMAADEGVSLSPSTLTGVLGACAKRSRWREALDLLQQARPVLRRSLSSSSSLPSGKCEREKSKSKGSGEEEEEKDEDGRGGAGDERPLARKKKRLEGSVVAAYTLAMVACRGAGRHTEGLRVLSMLEEDGGSGDEAFFRVALKCCAKAEAEGGGVGEGNGSGATVADRVLGDMSAQGIQCRVEGFTDVAQVGLADTRGRRVLLAYSLRRPDARALRRFPPR